MNVQACRQKTEKRDVWEYGARCWRWTDERNKAGDEKVRLAAVTAGTGSEEQRWGDDEMEE